MVQGQVTASRAIVLAAGRGSRLSRLTDDRPKCLVPVCGRPLLDWQLDALKRGGITEIAIARGYQGHLLDRPGVTFFENARWATTNMVRTLECASTWLREDVSIVSYSDIIYFAPTIRALNGSAADIALTFDRNWRTQWESRFDDPLIDAETFAVDDDGLVTDIGRKPSRIDEINGQYMGLLRFTPRGWAAVEQVLAGIDPPAADRLDMTSLLQRLIAAGVRVHGIGVTDPWFEIDSPTDLAACEQVLRTTGLSGNADAC